MGAIFWSSNLSNIEMGKKLITPYSINPLQKCEGLFFLKFLFRTDLFAQHKLLKSVKGKGT